MPTSFAPPWTPTSLRRGDALAFAVSPGAVYVSLYDEDHSGLYRSADDGRTWAATGDGLPSGAPAAALLWHDGRVFAGVVAAGLFASADDGASWDAAGDGLPAAATVFCLAAHGGALFAGTESAGLFRSADGGATWTPASRGLPFDGRTLSVFALAAGGDALYAQHPFGLHRSADGGATWEALGTGLPAHTPLTLLAAHDDHVFASSPGRLYHSPDGGATWTARDGGMWRQHLLRGLAVCGRTLFAGTQGTPDAGLYASTDGGATWASLRDGLPAEAWSVYPCVARTHLLAGVGTRGVWRRPLAPAGGTLDPAPPPFVLGANAPNPFDSETAIPYTLAHPADVVLEVCDLLGRPVATLVDGPAAAGAHHARFDAGDLPGGFYFYRLTAGTVSQSRQMLLLR